jgi:cyclopropane fatty-acyl-phospholipid synthase-like methyltransferase
MPDNTRSLTDLFGMFGPRRVADAAVTPDASVTNVAEAAYPTKALQKFLASLQASDGPVLLDLGPVVGSNVAFFGEHLGCRLRVEDVAKDIDQHVKENKLEQLPEFFATRFKEAPGTVDGILCWDVLDYLDRPAAQALATALSKLLRPDGTLLGFFSTAEQKSEAVYTKYVVVDEANLRYRTYPAQRPRQRSLLNGDIIKLFKDLRVTDSFLMKSKVREMLFRKPAAR